MPYFNTSHQDLVGAIKDREKLRSFLLQMTKDYYNYEHKFEYTFPESVFTKIVDRCLERVDNYQSGFDALNFFGSFIIFSLKRARDEDRGKSTGGLTLITSRSEIGQNYRGIWVETNKYLINDVVWKDLDKNNTRYGSETYFVCNKNHIAVNEFELSNPDLWTKEERWHNLDAPPHPQFL